MESAVTLDRSGRRARTSAHRLPAHAHVDGGEPADGQHRGREREQRRSRTAARARRGARRTPPTLTASATHADAERRHVDTAGRSRRTATSATLSASAAANDAHASSIDRARAEPVRQARDAVRRVARRCPAACSQDAAPARAARRAAAATSSTGCHAPSVTHTQSGSAGIATMYGSALKTVRFSRTSYASPQPCPSIASAKPPAPSVAADDVAATAISAQREQQRRRGADEPGSDRLPRLRRRVQLAVEVVVRRRRSRTARRASRASIRASSRRPARRAPRRTRVRPSRRRSAASGTDG